MCVCVCVQGVAFHWTGLRVYASVCVCVNLVMLSVV